MTCGCENSTCEVCHSNGCTNEATVPCMYVGAICGPCAQFMPDEYLPEGRLTEELAMDILRGGDA